MLTRAAAARARRLAVLFAFGVVPGAAWAHVHGAGEPAAASESPAPAVAPAPGPGLGARRASFDLPLRRDGDPDTSDRGWATVSASLVVLLALGGAVALQRRGASRGAGAGWAGLLGRRGSAALRVVHSTRLTNRASVHVVAWGPEEWLVGCTDQAITVLGSRLPQAPPEPGSGRAAGDAP